MSSNAPFASLLVDQVISAIEHDIESRALLPGVRLPSIRAIAAQRSISRHTAVAAYDRLVATGFLESRRGSGFYVARPAKTAVEAAGPKPSYEVAMFIREVLEDRGNVLRAGGPWLPDEWLDRDGVGRVIRALGREPGTHILQYGHPLGYAPLRRQLQLKLAELGIVATPEQIVLTNGSSHALELSARHFLQPGDTAFVEDPGYYNLFGFLRQNGIRLIGVPRNVDGPDIAALKPLLAQHRPKVFFIQSQLHNPTGSDTSLAVMHRLLAAAEEFGFTIIEDDTYCDLDAAPRARLATLDQFSRVIYVRSFSKTLSGSMRVGFAVASEPVARALVNRKVLSCITTSQFNEKLVHRLLVDGHYRKFLDQLRIKIGQAREAALCVLGNAGMSAFCEPASGNFVWARFPHIDDSTSLVADARRQDVMLAPGAAFRPNLEPSPYMRFNVSACADPRLGRFLSKVR